MPTREELLQEAARLDNEINAASERANDLRAEWRKVKAEYAKTVAAEDYSLYLGDLVEVTEKKFHKTDIFKVRITRFECYGIVIHAIGVRIKKDGTDGARRESIVLNTVDTGYSTWHKVSE